MSENANNYVGHELDWTEYMGTSPIPIGPFVVRIENDSRPEGYEYFFGEKHKNLCIIRGAFDYDYHEILTESHGKWASLNFVFQTDN